MPARVQDLPGDRGAISGSQKKYTLELRLGSTSSTPTATSWPAGLGTDSSLGKTSSISTATNWRAA